MGKVFTCGICSREFATRRSFYVCDRCTAITCKKCVGNGCDPTSHNAGETKSFVRLLDAFDRLKALGFDMSAWRLKP